MASAEYWATELRASESPPFRRCHGSLATITDSERRSLRSIGVAAREAATWTSSLLMELLADPGVRIFQGVQALARDLPRIPHAASAGRGLVLIESVAWPAGRYDLRPGGRIHNDGVYIGQSVRQLATAVRHWREVLPDGHRVSAVIVVHLAHEGGGLILPSAAGRDLEWACAGDAVRCIRARLPLEPETVSLSAIAALAAAAAEEGR